MDKQRDDDGIWMFPKEFQTDIEAGIDRAISETGVAKGYYANKLNIIFQSIEPYLQTSFVGSEGIKLGASGRRELIKAYCLDDVDTIRQLQK